MRSFSLEGRQNYFLVLTKQLQHASVRRFTKQNHIDSRLSEHELALLGSDYPFLASNAWSRRNTEHHADANNGRGINELKSIGDLGASLGEWRSGMSVTVCVLSVGLFTFVPRVEGL
jgi:hypothetical protein